MKATEELEFALPGDWLSLDLRGGSQIVNRRIHALVERAVGNQDDRANLRRLMREHLEQAAVEGKVVKTDHIHIARTIVGGVPLSATLAISRPGISLPANGTAQTQAETLLTLVAGAGPTVIAHPRMAMVRSLDIVAGGTDDTRLPHLTVSYWMQLPETGHLVVFTFTSSMTNLAAELTLLFDAIASSVHLRAG
jgi:hypothetical protein